MQLLMGLNEPYSTMHDSILMMSPIPDTRRVHGLTLQHERQMDVANRQITSHAMQISRSIRGGTRPDNSMGTRPLGAEPNLHHRRIQSSDCSFA
ncbi:hypothetical protein Peur_042893 [Populus x canadensis]